MGEVRQGLLLGFKLDIELFGYFNYLLVIKILRN